MTLADYMILGMALVLVYILWLGSTAKTEEGRENWFYGVAAGVMLSVIGWITAKQNEDRIETAWYKAGVLSRFIGGLKNLFIRK